MSTPVSRILHGFHNFSGISIGERKKELFFLLRQYEGLITSADIDNLILQLKPKTYFEQKMFVDILLHFKREKELLSVFLGGNEILIKPLWKQVWFFEKLLKNSPVKTIINEIFPHLSYVFRMRFLKNVPYYTSDEDKVDELYDMVYDKYGPLNAQHVFTGCSWEKKLKALTSGHNIKISNKHLIFLYKNKTEHFQKLLELRAELKILDFYDHHSKAFNVIAGSDNNIFNEIFKANECSNIGKRLTTKIVKNELEYIIENASTIHQKLHQRSLAKNLKSNFEDFFFSTWPSSLKRFRIYPCFSLMKYYPNTKYVEIIQQGLQKCYNTSLSENPNLIEDKLLENTKNIQLRESLLELRMRDSKDEYTLPKYYGIEKSILILKKKISAADGVRTRENLIAALVNTCKINDDVDALLKVQEYFNFRHKNDDDTIKTTFLHEIKSCFDLTLLTDEHWRLLLELLKWQLMKNASFFAGEFYMLHIKYLHKNNAQEDAIHKLLFNDNYIAQILRCFTTAWKIIDDVPKLQRYFLEILMKPLPTSSYEKIEKTDLYFEFFKAILVWNKSNPNGHINYYLSTDIKVSIKSTLEKPCHSFSSNMDYLINFIKGKIPCEDKQFLVEIEEIFWKNLSDKFNSSAIEYYLRNRPVKIVENFDVFIGAMKNAYFCESVIIWRLLKHYNHLQLVEKVIDYLTRTTELDLSRNIGIGFATLIPSDDYIKLMVEHKTEMLDVDDAEQVKKHHLTIELLRYAKYNDSPTLLPYIVKLCEGDSLHDALAPLYYYFQHSAEKHLSEQLQILSNRAVSVRKHSVKLACAVTPVAIVYTLIQQMTEAEKNQSVLEHMYWKTFKYFLIDGSERFWLLLQLQLKSLDISESNAFKESCDIKKIPKAFRQSYLEFIWKLLDERENQGVDVSDFKESLIRSLSPELFRELSYEFCSVFIKEKFLKFGSNSERTVTPFVLNCLKYCTQKEILLNDILDVIIEFKKNYILHPEFKISRKSRLDLGDFVSSIFYDHRDFDIAIIRVFSDNWMKLFTSTEHIRSYTQLNLLTGLNAVNNLDEYILKIAELFKKFVAEFGILGMIDCFKNAVGYLLPNDVFGTKDSNEKLYKLAFKLTEFKDPHLSLLAITLLPSQSPESKYCIEVRSKLIEIVKKSNDKSVLINLYLYIDSLDD